MHTRISDRLARWQRMYEGTGQRFVYMISFPQALKTPRLWPQYRAERIDWALRLHDAQMEQLDWLDDDMIPHLSMVTGTEIFAEAIGCRVYRPDDNMPFAIPFITSAEAARHLRIPRVEDTPLMDLLAMAQALRDRAGDGALLKLPDIQSPMDILAQVWDKTDLFMALVDEPELVQALAREICGLLTRFLDLWFGAFGTTYVAHHPDYPMQGGLTLSADEIGNVSPQLFDEMFLGELNRLSDHFGGIGIHCCAHAEHQWPGLKRVHAMRLLNLAQPMDVLMRGIETFPECVHFPYQLIDGTSHIMPDLLPNDYPKGARVVITQWADSREEAVDKAARLRQACGQGG